MPYETFFEQANCDRCGEPLVQRSDSYFNGDVICGDCRTEEKKIREELAKKEPKRKSGLGWIVG